MSGCRISELPLVVKKVRDVLKILPSGIEETDEDILKNNFLQAFDDRENEETREIIAGSIFFNFNSMFDDTKMLKHYIFMYLFRFETVFHRQWHIQTAGDDTG